HSSDALHIRPVSLRLSADRPGSGLPNRQSRRSQGGRGVVGTCLRLLLRFLATRIHCPPARVDRGQLSIRVPPPTAAARPPVSTEGAPSSCGNSEFDHALVLQICQLP